MTFSAWWVQVIVLSWFPTEMARTKLFTMQLLVRILLGCTTLAVLGGTPLHGQFEVDPDHFEMANTEPFLQPVNSSGWKMNHSCPDTQLRLPCTVSSLQNPLGKLYHPGPRGILGKPKNKTEFSAERKKYRSSHRLALVLAGDRAEKCVTERSSCQSERHAPLALVRVPDLPGFPRSSASGYLSTFFWQINPSLTRQHYIERLVVEPPHKS